MKFISKFFQISIFVALFTFAVLSIPYFANAAEMYMVLDKASVKANGTFSASVYVSTTSNAPINNAESTLSFPADLISVDSISTTGSIFNIWVSQPTFSNTAGTINFNGGVPTPGYNGAAGLVAKINFRAIKEGTPAISFGTSAVRANDGRGTDVLTATRPATILVSGVIPAVDPAITAAGMPKAPTINSTDMPDQNAWYTRSGATFTWSLPTGIDTVQLVLSRSPSTIPTISYAPPIRSKTLSDLTEGVLYLNARFKNSFGWGPVASRKIQIDTTAPEISELSYDVSNEDLVTIDISTKDTLSGLNNISVFSEDSEIVNIPATNGTNRIELPAIESGDHFLTVRSTDLAGNFAESDITVIAPEQQAPTITRYPEFVKTGSRIEIRGKSPYKDGQVLVWVKVKGQNAESFLVKPDEDRIFAFTTDTIEETGEVTVWAQTIRGNNVTSKTSEEVHISAKENDVRLFGRNVAEVMSVAIVLLVLLLALFALIYFAIRKSNSLKRKLRKDIARTEEDVHKVFKLLRDDNRRYLRILERASTKRKLTPEESRIFTELSEDLEDTEDYLTEQIKKIGK
jgi:hypothetical protein